MELISIIIPIYQVEKYLQKCIESVINQTYKHLEIILIDDGSLDNCPKICDEYAKKDSRIVVIHQKNSGLSAARNTGIENSTGEYLVFVDSDDTVELNLVEDLYKCVKKSNCKMAACGRKFVFEDGKVICKLPKNLERVFSFNEAIIEMNNFYFFDMSAWGKIYNRNLFENIRFPEGKLSEDYFIMYQIIELAQKVAYISKPLYNYLQRTSSISRNKKINHDFILAAKEQMENLENRYPELKSVLHTAYASANLTVADFYIKNRVKCSSQHVNEFRMAIKENLKYINNNKNISISKKIQFYLFLFNYKIYKFIFVIYRKLRRV